MAEPTTSPADGAPRGAGLTDPATWVEQHGDALFQFAISRLPDRSAAEDLVQETFLAALHARADFAGQSTERTWLIAILKRRILDHYRRQARRGTAAIDEAEWQQYAQRKFNRLGKWREPPRAWPQDPAQALEQSEFWDVFQRCLAGLPERLSAVITLRQLGELETEEVCKVLDVTTTNLWTLLHRARMRLRDCLERNWFAPKD